MIEKEAALKMVRVAKNNPCYRPGDRHRERYQRSFDDHVISFTKNLTEDGAFYLLVVRSRFGEEKIDEQPIIAKFFSHCRDSVTISRSPGPWQQRLVKIWVSVEDFRKNL